MPKPVFAKSSRKGKKYKATFADGKVVHFGASSFQHFQDSTGLGLYTHKDHSDPARRKNIWKRHGCAQKSGKTAGGLSCKYLW